MDTPTLTIECYHAPKLAQASTAKIEALTYTESLEKAQELMNIIHYIIEGNKNDPDTASMLLQTRV